VTANVKLSFFMPICPLETLSFVVPVEDKGDEDSEEVTLKREGGFKSRRALWTHYRRKFWGPMGGGHSTEKYTVLW
jgi:hypothetical protein